MHIRGYTCFAQMTIPLEQLERGQTTFDYQSNSTEGSGWTCGSEAYRCSFFLPPCLLKVLREKPEGETRAFVLQQILNRNSASDYPHDRLTDSGQRFRCGACEVVRIKEEQFEMLQHICKGLAGKADATMDELLGLQNSAPKPVSKAS